MIKIQSFSDVITNSSSSVFVVFCERNIQSIKDITNAILAIDGKYTFDDLFDVCMSINSDLFERNEVLEEEFKDVVDIYFDKDLTWEQANFKTDALIKSFSEERRKRFNDLLWECADEYDYDSCIKSPYDGIIISPKKDDITHIQAASALRCISEIFDLDFCYD